MITSYFQLLRPQQWYKNCLVFLALIFSGNLLNIGAVQNALIAFISFCALSSATYAINDYVDRNKDKYHPDKWNRPIASGAVNGTGATLLTLILLVVGFGTAITLPDQFLYAALGYFVLSQIYTIWLKHEAYADILTIATNFVIRAVGGAFAINVWVSPWLIIGVFFLALFLLLGKRRSETTLLKNKSAFQRKTLASYTPEVANRLSSLATTALVICYSLYVFFGEHQKLFVTLPVALYAIFRYEHFISAGSVIARKPEKVFKDARMTAAMLLWGLMTIAALYF